MSCQGLINYNYNYNCAVHNTQNKMYTREPGSQVRGQSFKKGRVSTTSAIAIQSKKVCVNNQTGCLEILWNPHSFK